MSAELIWIVLGFVLIGAELFVNAFILVFFGIAALVVGVALWLGLPHANGLPFIVFSVASVGMLLLLRSRFQDWFKGGSTAAETDDDFLGFDAQVESGFDAATPTRGKVSFRGASWRARSDAGPFAPGDFVRICNRDSSTLIVRAIKE
jgi:membrane protein implicated in regulation of membrane protease activity